jgi:hypothetical protein
MQPPVSANRLDIQKSTILTAQGILAKAADDREIALAHV